MNTEPEPTTRRRNVITGVDVERDGQTITFTVSDEYEAELLEAVLGDGELMLLLLLVSTLRRLPPGKCRFDASRLTAALLASQANPQPE